MDCCERKDLPRLHHSDGHEGLNPHYGEWGRVFERPRSNRSTSASSEEANSTKGIEKWGSWMNIMDGMAFFGGKAHGKRHGGAIASQDADHTATEDHDGPPETLHRKNCAICLDERVAERGMNGTIGTAESLLETMSSGEGSSDSSPRDSGDDPHLISLGIHKLHNLLLAYDKHHIPSQEKLVVSRQHILVRKTMAVQDLRLKENDKEYMATLDPRGLRHHTKMLEACEPEIRHAQKSLERAMDELENLRRVRRRIAKKREMLVEAGGVAKSNRDSKSVELGGEADEGEEGKQSVYLLGRQTLKERTTATHQTQLMDSTDLLLSVQSPASASRSPAKSPQAAQRDTFRPFALVRE